MRGRLTMTRFDILLNELIQWKQFVNYQLKKQGKRTTKIPVDANGYNINPHTPGNWRSFDEVLDASSKIGFVLTDRDPFLFIDLDHVFKDEKLCEWAEELVAALPTTYTEISPSSDGLHLYYILNDTPVMPGNKHAFGDGTALEVYFDKRYFTITGNIYVDSPITTVDWGEL